MIKNVPEEAEQNIKEMAMFAVENFLRHQIDPETKQQFQNDIDTIRKINGLEPKYKTEQIENK